MFLNLKLQWLALIDRLLRKMGFWGVEFDEHLYRSNKCELTLSWAAWYERIGIQLIQDTMSSRKGATLHVRGFGCSLFLFNNWLTKRISWTPDEKYSMSENIGVYASLQKLELTLLYKSKRWSIGDPFRLEWYRTRTMLTMSPITWHDAGRGDVSFKYGDPRWSESFEFTYVNALGKQQPTVITLQVEQREYRRKCLSFTRLFGRTNLDCRWQSSAELGREAGSYKGGIMGSTVTMLPNETPRDAFVRYINRKVM